MKKNIYILIVEDEPEVLDAIVRDLSDFESHFIIELCDTAEEARDLIRSIYDDGGEIGLILCDHVLPGDNGVELLVEMEHKEETDDTKKVLITGQAGLEETVRAVNEANLEYYIAKPWEKEDLVQTVKKQLTDYVIQKIPNPLPYMNVLQADRIADSIRKGKGLSDQ